MRSIYVPLPETAREALCSLAEREWRDPRDQATVLLLEGLKQRGALPPEPAASVTRAPESGREAVK